MQVMIAVNVEHRCLYRLFLLMQLLARAGSPDMAGDQLTNAENLWNKQKQDFST